MRKPISIILILSILISFLTLGLYVLAVAEKPTRTINVVYDDSNSMLMDGLDRWCHARYALQVFTAMLDENDTLNIFLMSSYTHGKYKGNPDYTVVGRDSASKKVKVVYEDMKPTMTGGTPFATVEAAYSALPENIPDHHENWLVVLTDGDFDESVDLDKKYREYTEKKKNLKIITLAIGEDLNVSKLPQPTTDCYLEKVASSSEVTNAVAKICNMIFKRNEISTDGSKISFDIPVSEIVVLAQGETVSVGNLEGAHPPEKVVVQMRQSDKVKATIHPTYSSQIAVTELSGIVATYKPIGDYIDTGSYDLGIKGASSISVYYKPKTEIKMDIRNEEGVLIESAEIEAGKYSMDCYLCHPGTKERITSTLIGNPQFTVTFNGKPMSMTNNEYILEFEKGHATLEANGVFLTYNTVSMSCNYTVKAAPAPLTFVFNPEIMNTTVKNLDEAKIVMTVYRENALLDETVWKSMELPQMLCDQKVSWEVIRGNDVSTFIISPEYYNGDIFKTAIGEVKFTVSAKCAIEDSISKGVESRTIQIEDDISFLERLHNWLKENGVKLVISLLILILLLGYVPGIKKYLPKRLKKNPAISKKPTGLGKSSKENGLFARDLVSKLIPYKAETGSIRFAPSGSKPAIPRMKVKAAGSGAMYIMNFKDYAGKDYIKFGGVQVDKETKKPVRISSGTECRVKTTLFISTCTPSVN